MIREVSDSIFQNKLSGNNVIINPVNCKAILQPGISQQVCKKYPGWYDNFHEYCSWFNKSVWNSRDHFDEILGSFHRFKANDNTIICSAFVQEGPSKNGYAIDLDSWDKILRKIEKQTQRAKRVTGKKWSLHIPMNVCLQETLDGDSLMNVIEDIFGKSDVDIVIHGMRG